MRQRCTNERRRNPANRRGVVVAEFALCVPILFFFSFAAIKFSRINMIRQSVENAVYEGSRRGIVPGATADDCRNATRAVLNSISVVNAQVDVAPAIITPNSPDVTGSITVPIDNNSWVMPFFFEGRSVAGSMTMRRERFNTSSVP